MCSCNAVKLILLSVSLYDAERDVHRTTGIDFYAPQHGGEKDGPEEALQTGMALAAYQAAVLATDGAYPPVHWGTDTDHGYPVPYVVVDGETLYVVPIALFKNAPTCKGDGR